MSEPGKRLVLTPGDPAGVGPEVLELWLLGNPEEKPLVVGHPVWLESLGSGRGFEGVPVGGEYSLPEPGKPTLDGARIAYLALEEVAKLGASGHPVVTGPVSKEWMQRVGFCYPGQTEFFADRWGGEAVMGFGGERLRLVLATWHIPLAEVSRALSRELLERTVRAAGELARASGVDGDPRIGVCGLNPHAGEGGLLGSEERDRIDPWLSELRRSWPGLSVALPGDTLFWRQLQGDFDVVVALYHDQGLAPLKTVEFDRAANLTLGLRGIRTSPDHGTAFGLAGKGEASPTSFASAVEWAVRIQSLREEGRGA